MGIQLQSVATPSNLSLINENLTLPITDAILSPTTYTVGSNGGSNPDFGLLFS